MKKSVYLAHFEHPLHHAKHYLGFAHSVADRVEQHRAGTGARLMEVIRDKGIGFKVVRVWAGASRAFERKLKNRKNAPRLCPVCTGRVRYEDIDERTVVTPPRMAGNKKALGAVAMSR
jgi:predicted GIY-YIG superfamily endonuclease